jgi:DNA-binding transcriptional MerR regulator
MAMSVPTPSADDATDFTIEDLARHAGMTVRNIRAHQSNGLLPPPALRGRTGYYSRDHLARLHLIRDMQSEGFNLRAIAQILEAMPDGVALEVLGFERAVRTAWTDEPHEICSRRELAARFPGVDIDDLIRRSAELGLLTVVDANRVELHSPTLIHSGERLLRLGIPLESGHAVQEELNRHSQGVARAYVDLFLADVWQPFVADGKPDSQWPRIRGLLAELRPLAMESLLATFRMAMSRAIAAEMHRVLEADQGR